METNLNYEQIAYELFFTRNCVSIVEQDLLFIVYTNKHRKLEHDCVLDMIHEIIWFWESSPMLAGSINLLDFLFTGFKYILSNYFFFWFLGGCVFTMNLYIFIACLVTYFNPLDIFTWELPFNLIMWNVFTNFIFLFFSEFLDWLIGIIDIIIWYPTTYYFEKFMYLFIYGLNCPSFVNQTLSEFYDLYIYITTGINPNTSLPYCLQTKPWFSFKWWILHVFLYIASLSLSWSLAIGL